jgi:hypothetical protein
VAIALWFRVGLTRSDTVRFNLSRLGDLGINRWSGRRGLDQLEVAGLVEVKRRAGGTAVVRVLEARNAERDR